ncbi:recombinase family protein [Nocardia vermiculata]|uniref:Recombinase family protein n=1 Tax=Nocardia vermiculata TaxID=257274 RepID=A0A846XSW9_9NOCA|nr:recombinase family protein [Nocardia vermiculata]NKY50183.1 recombinase family protein [Nocardia vermiculata]
MTTTKATTGKLTILRIAVYLRFSQDRTGQELGFARHEPACLALAERIGVQRGRATMVTIYKETVSASAYGRKARAEYRRMITDIEAGQLDMVIAYHNDRLIRDMGKDLQPLIDLVEATGVEVEFCSAGRWELATASGKANARLMATMAAYESDIKSERIKLQRVQQAQAGKFHGGIRPYGFEPDGVTVRQTEAREIARMYEQVVAGVSLRQIVMDLNRREVPTATARGPWTSQTVRDIILRHRNAGWSVHKGAVVGKAVWPALVSEETWHAAVAVVTDPARRTTPGATPKWLGSGLYLCGVCGKPGLRAGVSGSGRRPSYRCKLRDLTGQGHVSRDAGQVDALVEETVVTRLAQPDAIAQLTAGQGSANSDAAALRLEQAALRQRLDSLAGMFAAGDIDERQLTTGSSTLKAKITEIDSSLASLGMRSPLDELKGRGDIRTAWFGTQPDRSDGLALGSRRAIVDMLLAVTVLPAPRGRRASGKYFDPEFIRLEWKQ